MTSTAKNSFHTPKPSQPFDGSYTAKVPGAEYKIQAMAEGYTSVFYGVDASGSDWSSTTWEDGAATLWWMARQLP